MFQQSHLSLISIQQKLALALQIVAELSQTHAHKRWNEGELLGFNHKKALYESWKNWTFLLGK